MSPDRGQAAYTYLGQFVDHDITLEQVTGGVDLDAPDLAPLPLAQIRDTLRNTRTATLDLDSVYDAPAAPDPDNAARMRIGEVTALPNPAPPESLPPGKLPDNDLPRRGRDAADPRTDREALIGDPRNDENTLIGQLHVAFLKAHNRLVDEGRSFPEARRILRQHYQHIVVHGHLPRICDRAVVDGIVADGNRWFDPFAEPFFMPLEFAGAAFRFGHTMVRSGYDFNVNLNLTGGVPASLGLLFTFSALSGQLGFGTGPAEGFGTLPHNWIVQWEDTLSGIARAELGSGGRWPEIFASNRAVLGNPDRIRPGQVLSLPTGPAVVPQLRFHVVCAGETLSGIARVQLGDAARWPEIFALNRSVLTNPDVVVVVGQVLQLPPK